MYKHYPAWKRAVVNHVYLPLFRFFHKSLNLFPPARVEPDGTYSWLVHQGCFLTEEEARKDAKRYAHGYVVPNVPLGNSLTASVAEESAIYFPNNGKGETKLDFSVIREEVDLLKASLAKAARVI